MIRSTRSPQERAEAQIRRLFPGREPIAQSVTWAAGVVSSAHIDPRQHPWKAIRHLRRSDMPISLLAARYLVQALIHPDTDQRRTDSPARPRFRSGLIL